MLESSVANELRWRTKMAMHFRRRAMAKAQVQISRKLNENAFIRSISCENYQQKKKVIDQNFRFNYRIIWLN